MPIIGLLMLFVFLTFFFRLLSGRDHWYGPGDGPTFGGGSADTPASIARRRFARGEISRQELLNIQEMLPPVPDLAPTSVEALHASRLAVIVHPGVPHSRPAMLIGR